MAENLNYETDSSYCYDDNQDTCAKYGRLYKWEAAKTACPSGFHLPIDEEWNMLRNYYVKSQGISESDVGKYIKTTEGWDDNGNGLDIKGFSAWPSGYLLSYEYYFDGIGYEARFWSASESWDSMIAIGVVLTASEDDLKEDDLLDKNEAYFVRCLSDASSSPYENVSKTNWKMMNPDIKYGVFKDNRDGQFYRTVQIGSQTWMAENLNYCSINVLSYCYDNESANCETHGSLYTWSQATRACPDGYHLPSLSDWNDLLNYVLDDNNLEVNEAGYYLLYEFEWDYIHGYTDKKDKYGFCGRLGGIRNGDFYSNMGDIGYFWTSSEKGGSTTEGYYYILDYSGYELDHTSGSKELAMSVRCIKDSN